MPLPQKIVAGLTTKADKIRALDAAGFSRTEIAQFLNIRYQHVRNTLVAGPPKQKRSPNGSKPNVPRFSATLKRAEPWPKEKLLAAGFELLGACALNDDGGFVYSDTAPTDAGVYAFAVDGTVKYVGLTRFGLRTRLGHYVYGHKAQKTSHRIKGLIMKALHSEHKVEVLIAQPPALEWNGLPVDGPSGLETGLIKLIRPEWNVQGRG